MESNTQLKNTEVKESFYSSAILPSCKKIVLANSENEFLFMRDEFLISKETGRIVFEKPDILLIRGYIGLDGADKFDKFDKIKLPADLVEKDFDNMKEYYMQNKKARENNIKIWKEANKKFKNYIPREDRLKEFAEYLENQVKEE